MNTRRLVLALTLAATLTLGTAAGAAADPSSYDGMRLTTRSVSFAVDRSSGPTCTVEAQSTGTAVLALPQVVVGFTAPGGRVLERVTVSLSRPVELLPGMRAAGTGFASHGSRATGCGVLSTSSSSAYQLPDTAYRVTVTADTIDPSLGVRRVRGTVTNTGRRSGQYPAVTLVVRDRRGVVRWVSSTAIPTAPPGRTVAWDTVLDPAGRAGVPGQYRLEARVDAGLDLAATHDVHVTGVLPETFRRGSAASVSAHLGGGTRAGSNEGRTLVLVRVVGGSTRRVASARTDGNGFAGLAVPTATSGRYLVLWLPGVRGAVPTASAPFDVRVVG